MPKAFICHSSHEAEEAMALVQALESLGTTCWIAPRNIPAGSPYPEQIVSAIKQCSIFVVILSQSANGSPHVLREVELAVSQRKPVLPVRVDSDEPSPAFTYLLASLQWVDATRYQLKNQPERIANQLLFGDLARKPRRRRSRTKIFVLVCLLATFAALLAYERFGTQKMSSSEASSAWQPQKQSQDVGTQTAVVTAIPTAKPSADDVLAAVAALERQKKQNEDQSSAIAELRASLLRFKQYAEAAYNDGKNEEGPQLDGLPSDVPKGTLPNLDAIRLVIDTRRGILPESMSAKVEQFIARFSNTPRFERYALMGDSEYATKLDPIYVDIFQAIPELLKELK